MQTDVVRALIDYMYWVNHLLLERASRLRPEQFASESAAATTRGLRATLVHELDVEWSWRLRLQGRPPAEWGVAVELRSEDFPDVAALRARWERDESEMRAWIDALTDEEISAPPPLPSGPPRGRRSLGQYVIHIFTHAMQQQSDAATLLTLAGESPGDLGYLEYLRATGQ